MIYYTCEIIYVKGIKFYMKKRKISKRQVIKHTKSIVLKTLLLLCFPFFILALIFYNDEKKCSLFLCCFALCSVTYFFLVLVFNFEIIEKKKKVKIKKYKINCYNCDEYKMELLEKLNNSYNLVKSEKNEFCEMYFYVLFNPGFTSLLSCITLIKCQELPKDYNEIIKKFQSGVIVEYYEKKGMKSVYNTHLNHKIFLVEKENLYFNKAINAGVYQTKYIGYTLFGISFMWHLLKEEYLVIITR